jgi:hypothetical protein
MKTNANTRIRLEATFQIKWCFSAKFRLARSPIKQRHITFIATEEVKLDGYRAIGVKTARNAVIYSRNGKNFNRSFSIRASSTSSVRTRSLRSRREALKRAPTPRQTRTARKANIAFGFAQDRRWRTG